MTSNYDDGTKSQHMDESACSRFTEYNRESVIFYRIIVIVLHSPVRCQSDSN